MTDQSTPPRTILYFPTIAVPNGAWLRRALLYWDEVASIVPLTDASSGKEPVPLIPYTPEVNDLSTEGLFKPMDPTRLWTDARWHTGLVNEFLDEFESSILATFPRLRSGELRFSIHVDKVFHEVEQLLTKYGLGEFDRDKTYEMHDLYPETYKSQW